MYRSFDDEAMNDLLEEALERGIHSYFPLSIRTPRHTRPWHLFGVTEYDDLRERGEDFLDTEESELRYSAA